ncbi:hypothetical protein D3C76_952250 [compost metagenome]
MIVLDFLGSLLVLGDIHSTQGAHVDSGARLEHVGQQQADDDGDGGDDLEVEDGLQADAAELLRVAHAGDADHQRCDHDRYHDHLDQADEDVAGRLQDIADPPGLFGRIDVVEYGADGDADEQTDDDLPGQAELGFAHIESPLILVEVGSPPATGIPAASEKRAQ